jgi:type I restriction enzyme S subunit
MPYRFWGLLDSCLAADASYVCAYLRTYTGERLLEKGVYGSTGQLSLSNGHIRKLPILILDERVQKYIGDKVRQAERLRAWAKELRADVDVILNGLNLPTKEAPSTINRVSPMLLETRLDPRPYRTHYIGLVDQIKMIRNSLIADVSELASGCPVSSDDFIQAGEVPLIRIRNIGFDEFIDIDTGVDKSVYAEETKYHAKEDMIVLGMDGIFRAQFFLADELPMLVNQRVAMLTTTDIRAELLTHWLNRAEGQMQLNQWAVKTTVEHTSLSDIGRVRIPRLERDVEDQLADKLLNARLAYRYSRFLTTAAKVLVEALIEGQLTENQLIAAQDKLQTGNNALDRNILNRLKTDGVDGKGQSLFADLDQLYSLFEQAERS